jgi:DUF4097 and DUF4098 domain-containing protein YvlB
MIPMNSTTWMATSTGCANLKMHVQLSFAEREIQGRFEDMDDKAEQKESVDVKTFTGQVELKVPTGYENNVWRKGYSMASPPSASQD